MKVKEYKAETERRVLISMVLDVGVLGRMAGIWKSEGLFPSKWSNLVAGWCVAYYNEYNESPGAAIEQVFRTWAADNYIDDDTLELVEGFLHGLSDYSGVGNLPASEFVVDKAMDYFNKIQLRQLGEYLSNGATVDQCRNRLAAYADVGVSSASSFDAFSEEAVKEAFSTSSENLIEYPGPLGRFFRGQLGREQFVAFNGPEKRGKSFWLMDLAWQAMRQRRRVAVFEVGDMSKRQIMRRLMSRATGLPKDPCTVLYPVSLHCAEGQPVAEVGFKERVYKQGISYQAAKDAVDKRVRGGFANKLRLSVHSNSSMTVQGLRVELAEWYRKDNWVPDVVIIDYADILAPPMGVADTRDQINATWKQLRRMSQELCCLVVTATQADTASYDVQTVSMKNFSEDKRKNAHVTGTVGINQTAAEADIDVTRLNWVNVRDGDMKANQCVHVAGCRALSRMAVHSSY